MQRTLTPHTRVRARRVRPRLSRAGNTVSGVRTKRMVSAPLPATGQALLTATLVSLCHVWQGTEQRQVNAWGAGGAGSEVFGQVRD